MMRESDRSKSRFCDKDCRSNVQALDLESFELEILEDLLAVMKRGMK